MSRLAPIRPSDARRLDRCSFNGIARQELDWRGARLFGGPTFFLCESCLGAAVEGMREPRGEPAGSVEACSFCGGSGRRTVSGGGAVVCCACVEAFEARLDEPASPWSVVRGTMIVLEDGLSLMRLFEASGFALSANDRPIGDVLQATDAAEAERELALMVAGELMPHSSSPPEQAPGDARAWKRAIEAANTERLERFWAPLRTRHASVDQVAGFVDRCAQRGARIVG